MLVIKCMIWILGSIATMAATIYWYLPHILYSKTEYSRDFYVRKYGLVFFSLLCFSALCGLKVPQNVDSNISEAKLIVTYCVLCFTVLTDLENHIIPNVSVKLLVAFRIVLLVPEFIFEPGEITGRVVSSLVGVVFCMLTLLVTAKVTHGGIGMGDVKLLCGIALMGGLYMAVNTLIAACVFCGIVSVVLLISKKRKRDEGIAFAPFITAGYITTLLVGAY